MEESIWIKEERGISLKILIKICSKAGPSSSVLLLLGAEWFLVVGAVLCTLGCLAASLPKTYNSVSGLLEPKISYKCPVEEGGE